MSSWQWLVLLVVVGAVSPWLVADRAAPVLPRSLGALALRHTIVGAEAAGMVNRMHGRPVAEAWNAIGYYGSGQGGAVLYVTQYSRALEARDGEERMGEKIASGDYAFRGYRRGVVEGKTVAACVGLGQAHFIFSHHRSLYWLSVDPTFAEEALRSLLTSLR